MSPSSAWNDIKLPNIYSCQINNCINYCRRSYVNFVYVSLNSQVFPGQITLYVSHVVFRAIVIKYFLAFSNFLKTLLVTFLLSWP